MKGYLAVVLLGIVIPSVASSAEQASTDQPTKPVTQAQGAAGDDCDRLIATLELRKSETLPTTLEQAKAFKSSANTAACRQAQAQLPAAKGGQPANDQQAAGEAGKVLVQQPAAQVTIEQAPPEVTISQGQPQILIHQPAPTITVDIPQAEVVVRMPMPQVAVQQEKPKVDVQQAKPQVAVSQSGQANADAKVQLEQNGQPAVQYQSDEPKVVINKPKEQPKIRFEQMAAGDTASGSEPEKLANAANDQTGKPADQPNRQGGLQKLQVSQIKQMQVVNDRGDNLGTVEAVAVKNGTTEGFVIMRAGQFLGIGEKTIAVPFGNVWVRGNQLVITGLTNEQFGTLTEWKSADTNFKPLADDQVAEMKTAG